MLAADPAPTQAHSAQTVTMLGPNSVVGERFVIDAVAGSGGVGVVYRARDRASGRWVALKVMQYADGEGEARFEREARLLAELSHPGIVRHVAHGTTGDGQPYLVMEWLEGEDLAARLARAPLTVRDALTVARLAAEALGAAHTRGLVHRDVKPGNLFLAGGRADGLRVLDFGLARPEGASRDVTSTGAIVGTPGYMAPEQARGGRDVDARADVFALGCVLFECLTGRSPFAGRNAVEVLSSILLDAAPRVRALRPEVPDALDALVARMLAKQPDARPEDGVAVALQLAALEDSALAGVAGRRVFRAEAARTFRAPAEFVFAVFVDSDRFDRLVGASRTRYAYEEVDGETVRVGRAEMMGADVSWTEVGEWVEPASGWGERRFREGMPAEVIGLRFSVEPRGGGDCEASLTAYAVCGEAMEHMGAMLEAVFARQIERYFVAVEQWLARARPTETVPRVEHEGPGAWVRRALLRSGPDKVLLGQRGELRAAEFEQRAEAFHEAAASVDAGVRANLLALLRDGADDQVREVRPFELARAWACEERDALRACLYAARAGLLDLRWELLCPTCRVGAASEHSLAALGEGSFCAECQRDFGLDMASNVEAVFTVNRALREVDMAKHCASSPAFRPHVFAQLRLAGRETRELAVRLPAGRMRVRAVRRERSGVFEAGVPGEAPPRTVGVRVDAAGVSVVCTGPESGPLPDGAAGTWLTLANDTDAPAVVVLERDAGPGDTVTGATLCSVPEFLGMFSAEAPAAGRELSVSTVALLALEISGVEALCARAGDARAYAAVAHAQAHLEPLLARHGGAVMRAAGDALLACFVTAGEAEGAARAAVEAVARLAAEGGLAEISARAGVAAGPCLLVRARGRMDVFGRTDAAAWRALTAAAPGGVGVAGGPPSRG